MTQLDTLLSYLASGLSIIPIVRDGSKRPALDSWTPYQERLATADEVSQWVRQGHEGWGLVCGAVSGNVEVIDFDDAEAFAAWCEVVDATLLALVVIQRTPSGGSHVIYRCAEVEGNQKLARKATGETLIETRGEGGQILIEPTTAAYHPAGKPYEIVQGSLLAIPEIATIERAEMLYAARVLNEYFPVVKTWEPISDNGDGLRPGDDFAASTAWEDILRPFDWRPLYQRGDRIIWQRPGKDGPGGSAQTGGASRKTGFGGLYVYSTNAAPFESDRGYGKFHAYALLNYDEDFSAAARALSQQGFGRQLIIRPRQTEEPVVVPDTVEELLGAEVPALPESAQVDPALGNEACRWLNEYVAFSRRWSPRAFDDFHAACALWMLSTVAARRVVAHLGGPRYTNLYIALVARSSLWAKSTTAKIVSQALRDADLAFLLAPDDSTPQRFITDLVLRMPNDWAELGESGQEIALRKMAFVGQRGWFYEELGMKLDAMLSPGGFMADFRGILRAFDDCPESYRYASIGRGEDAVINPYIAMLGNMTPADMQRATQKSRSLWQDGFWARWAFITPPRDGNRSRERFPVDRREIPESLVEPVRQWHKRLGVPSVDIEPRRDADGKSSGRYDVYVSPMTRSHVQIDSDVIDAFYAYHDGLLDVAERENNPDYDSNYARFAEKALRIGLLVASLEHGDHLAMPAWALAQGITERWRRSLHELYAQASEPPPNEQEQREEQAMQIIMRHGEMTANEVARYAWGVSSGEMVKILDGLVDAGALDRMAETRRGAVRYAVAGRHNEA